jgi:hypothetical protein
MRYSGTGYVGTQWRQFAGAYPLFAEGTEREGWLVQQSSKECGFQDVLANRTPGCSVTDVPIPLKTRSFVYNTHSRNR